MKKSLFILLSIPFILASYTVFGQKKGEIKQYRAAIEQDERSSLEKFLKKYPESIFKPVIKRKIDSLERVANTTVRSLEKARDLFAAEGYSNNFIAIPYRRDNIEYIIGVFPTATTSPHSLKAVTLRDFPGGLEKIRELDFSLYTNDESLNILTFLPEYHMVTIEGKHYCTFKYMNSSNAIDERSRWKNNSVEVIFNLLPITDSTLYNAMFAGELTESGEIEGASMEATLPGTGSTLQMDYLLNLMNTTPGLIPYSEARIAEKRVISNWYERNPADTNTLSFIAVNENNPLVKLYKESKYGDSSNLYSAALIESMQTTLICVYVKQTSQYLLIWCEPAVDKNETGAKYLNTIYFESDSSLVLYYRQDNRMIKERINIHTRRKE